MIKRKPGNAKPSKLNIIISIPQGGFMINNKYIYKIIINTSSGVTLATIRSIFNYPPFFFEFFS